MLSNKIRFEAAIEKFDQLNSKDPNITTVDEKPYPKEVLYAQRMSTCLLAFHPSASEALQLAARSQHLCRWEIPRSNYPLGRKGYNLWRSQLKKFHAEKAGKVLTSLAYPTAIVERVQFLILKKQLKKDEETQILEDVICLVFLQFYFEDFSAGHPEDKVVSILRKTWKKMSGKGQQAALRLSLSKSSKQLVEKALAN